jgi:hypothetical protein
MTHHFMHEIISKSSKKGIIGAIDQGFKCLASRAAQNLVLVDHEGCPTSVHHSDRLQRGDETTPVNGEWRQRPEVLIAVVFGACWRSVGGRRSNEIDQRGWCPLI